MYSNYTLMNMYAFVQTERKSNHPKYVSNYKMVIRHWTIQYQFRLSALNPRLG